MTTCEPASMTLNLCVFERDLLERIGGVDENYATGYYDPILVFKIRELGYRAVQVGDAASVHLDRLTKATGGSGLTTAKHTQDTARFAEDHPDMRAEHGIWPMSFWRWPMSTTRRATALWWLSQHVPTSPLRTVFQNLAVLLEPLVTRYPVRRSAVPSPEPGSISPGRGI
jgi:GT2 family glycosyltransferase